MYHAKDGLSFERMGDGSVFVTYPGDAHEGEVTLDADTWASVVAAMSARGETGETFRPAQAFHMERDSGAATERATTEIADPIYRCPVCGSVLTMISLAEDAARCLACLYFWAPSTRLAKRKPPRSRRDPITTITESRPIPLSVTDDL